MKADQESSAKETVLHFNSGYNEGEWEGKDLGPYYVTCLRSVGSYSQKTGHAK